MKRIGLLYLIIIFLAAVLRLYQLGKTPIALTWDEVALGYDAYSILRTGRDQFGKFLPLTFRSLDDYKPPIYEYITVPSVVFFGLNSLSVRLPSAVFGILSVILSLKLAFLIFSKIFPSGKSSVYISLLSSFLLAVSPWHLQFSRAAFEMNVSVFITIAAVTTFLLGLKKYKFFLLSAFLFGLDLFSYHSTRVVAPLLLATLLILFNKQLPAKRYTYLFVIIYGIFVLAFIPILTSQNAQIRFKATNIFNPGTRYLEDKDLEKIFLEKRIQDKNAGFELAGKIFHNQRLIYTDYDTIRKALNNYLSNFGFEFLFIRGDVPLHHAPGFGLQYIWELPFLILGLIYIFRYGLNRYTVVILVWLLIAPVPDAITREAPHAVRTELMLPIFQLLVALGIYVCIRFLVKESVWVRRLFISVIITIFIINISFYLHQYYVHTNYELSKNWMYGRKEAVEFTEKIKDGYDRVFVSLRVDMPYIFWLFYTKYPPEKYLSEGGTISGGFADERNNFDKYEFRLFDYNSIPNDQKILLVGRPDTIPSDFSGDFNIIKTIYYLNGDPALQIAEKRR